MTGEMKVLALVAVFAADAFRCFAITPDHTSFVSPVPLLRQRLNSNALDRSPLSPSHSPTQSSLSQHPLTVTHVGKQKSVWANRPDPQKIAGKRLVTAEARFLRLSTIKTLRTLSEIKGKPLLEALAILEWSPRKPAKQVYKCIKSALANARQKYGANSVKPRIFTVLANRGPYRKRVHFQSRGRASVYRRPTTHIKVVLEV
ncbi:unnamed protein product [Vitrella brassicaformis CCMP3155]|uniref:Large ribosomal subunit protein uL22c n=1 Tax=Vitrella brassicaformis (strain CCMP3155) TaxID=1169540 RepID=A0A0G4EMF9_VITBC|nr:unnamed protein product [Vitrella brassicaformis CCMP3155]|eukprot:CEL98575.1 unnamed protein product [Vitrella brassicaformis CCMP3155]